jgi:hypothetical protein
MSSEWREASYECRASDRFRVRCFRGCGGPNAIDPSDRNSWKSGPSGPRHGRRSVGLQPRWSLLGESASGRDSGHMQETGIYVQFWEGKPTVKCARVETIFPLASLMQVPADHQLTSFLHRADAARAGAGTERDEVCI